MKPSEIRRFNERRLDQMKSFVGFLLVALAIFVLPVDATRLARYVHSPRRRHRERRAEFDQPAERARKLQAAEPARFKTRHGTAVIARTIPPTTIDAIPGNSLQFPPLAVDPPASQSSRRGPSV